MSRNNAVIMSVLCLIIAAELIGGVISAVARHHAWNAAEVLIWAWAPRQRSAAGALSIPARCRGCRRPRVACRGGLQPAHCLDGMNEPGGDPAKRV